MNIILIPQPEELKLLFLYEHKSNNMDIKEEYTHEQEKLIRMHPYLGVRYGCICIWLDVLDMVVYGKKRADVISY